MYFILETSSKDMLSRVSKHPDVIFSLRGKFFAKAILPATAKAGGLDFDKVSVRVLPKKPDELFKALRPFGEFQWRRVGRNFEVAVSPTALEWWDKRLKAARRLLKRRVDVVPGELVVDREHSETVKRCYHADGEAIRKYAISRNVGRGIHYG